MSSTGIAPFLRGRVLGVRALLEFGATLHNLNRYYGHYYSDDQGTVQILGYCLLDVIDSYRDKIDAVVPGLEVRGK